MLPVPPGAGFDRGAALERQLLAPFASHVDRDYLRVHARVLRRWSRRPAPPRPEPEVTSYAEQVRHLYRNTATGLGVNLALALLMTWVLWGRVPPITHLVWLALLLLLPWPLLGEAASLAKTETTRKLPL